MNSQQNQKLNSEQSPSFDEVSKLFSLPLSEAADILGVSAVVLKKICADNGLERWPHRRYLAGKSIEEIKEAARERTKGLASSSGSQIKDKALQSPQEMSKLNAQQQPGSRSVFTLRPHLDAFTPNFAIETSSNLDEFKYGFPSDGLSASSNKWWGWESGSPSDHDKSESVDSLKLESESSMNDDDDMKADLPEKAEGKMNAPESEGGAQEMGALSAIRKRALEEGQETLKFGFWNEFEVEKVGKKEKLLLARIFG